MRSRTEFQVIQGRDQESADPVIVDTKYGFLEFREWLQIPGDHSFPLSARTFSAHPDISVGGRFQRRGRVESIISTIYLPWRNYELPSKKDILPALSKEFPGRPHQMPTGNHEEQMVVFEEDGVKLPAIVIDNEEYSVVSRNEGIVGVDLTLARRLESHARVLKGLMTALIDTGKFDRDCRPFRIRLAPATFPQPPSAG